MAQDSCTAVLEGTAMVADGTTCYHHPGPQEGRDWVSVVCTSGHGVRGPGHGFELVCNQMQKKNLEPERGSQVYGVSLGTELKGEARPPTPCLGSLPCIGTPL